MTTAYTPILKLALPVTGELNGTWGDVVNQNITSMVEQAIAGLATINSWTANSHTLTTADGTTSESRCAMLVADDDGAGNPSAAATIICPNASKLYIVKNISGQTVTLKTAAGTGIAVPNNQTSFLFCDGTNVESCVTSIVDGNVAGNLTVQGNATVNGNTTLGNATTDTVTLTARVASVVSPSADNTYDLGSVANSWKDLYIDGTAYLALVDINGGAIDGTTIGATTPSTVVATQVDIVAQGDLRLQDTTGGEYVALQAPGTLASSYTLTLPVDDGTAGQALITDGSGVLSWSSAASGDVYGPASATDNAVARYDGTTGKIIQNSAVTIADDGATVIDANSTSAGLRITQVGTGNALLVEDSVNPDATPFVITADGRPIVGYTTSTTTANYSGTAVTPSFQEHGTSLGTAAQSINIWDSGSIANTAQLIFSKSKSSTIGTNTAVVSGDILGSISFNGADGTNFIPAASIQAGVDGTPGTNDMPGRLVFSTTADGAASPTERMRIGNGGGVGIGAVNRVDTTLAISKNITGSNVAFGILSNGVIQSDVTSSAQVYRSSVSTAAASFTLNQLFHYNAVQGAIGSGSSITNLYGFHADSTIVGATNNYGFFSNIASGTGRWNFYANGTAENYFGGNTVINVTDNTNAALRITQLGTGNALLVEDSANPDATPFVINASGQILRGITSTVNVTSEADGLQTSVGITNASSNNDTALALLNYANSVTNSRPSYLVLGRSNGAATTQTAVGVANELGALSFQGSDGTNFIRAASIKAAVDGTPGTNNMPGRLVFSTTPDGANTPLERMRIGNDGTIGIGTTNVTGTTFRVGKGLTGSTTVFGISSQGTILSDVTVGAYMFRSVPTTLATAFTLTTLVHYDAAQNAFGAGSTVTNQYGYVAGSSLTGATNNYGFFSNIASGTGRWNFYAAGTAANFFAGETTVNSGLTIGRTAVTAPAASDGNVFSGTYTPTLTNTTNITSSTAFITAYSRVGNVVTMSGVASITATATGAFTLNFSLPIASNFTLAYDATGTVASTNGTFIGAVTANTTDDTAALVGTTSTTSATSVYFSCTYRVK